MIASANTTPQPSHPTGNPSVANWPTVTSTRAQRISGIARNAFREAVRDRILYNLVLFVLLLIVASLFLGELSDSQEAKIIVDMGLSAMLIFGVFIAIFVGVGLVYKEIERRTVYAIFAKPVGRGELLLGKYLGLCLTLFVNVLVMGVGVSLALLLTRSGGKLAWRIWPAVILIFLELTIITAVALLFSTFSSPALSALLTFFVFIIGHFSADLKAFANALGTIGAKVVFNGLFYALPNLANYSYITPSAYGALPESGHFFGALLYAVFYNGLLLGLATLIFQRRNFK